MKVSAMVVACFLVAVALAQGHEFVGTRFFGAGDGAAWSRSLLGESTCQFNCSSLDCVECSIISRGPINTTVQFNLTTCKGSALSWACCRGTDGNEANACTLVDCDGSQSGVKCDGVKVLSYNISSSAINVTLQVHDGQADGDISCSGPSDSDPPFTSNCCGGSTGSCNDAKIGVCNYVIPLDHCTEEGPPGSECTVDTECSLPVVDPPMDCGEPKCNTTTNVCYVAPKSSTTPCRVIAFGTDCDEPEYCDGTNLTCPPDTFKNNTVECRAATGICDLPENCTGSGAECPPDAVKDNTVICREAPEICDVPETCDGTNKTCPPDTFKLNTTECRAKNGDCDLPENCTGFGAECPPDAVKDNTVMCRAAAVGTTCDVDDYCDGTNKTCTDHYQDSSHMCRDTANGCDVPEYCTGNSPSCPVDLYSDAPKIRAFKCGLVCYLCGITSQQLTQLAKTPGLGNCNMGNCQSFVIVSTNHVYCDPNVCLPLTCPNGKRLSNAEFGCLNATKPVCANKTDVGTGTTSPVCPPWVSLAKLTATSSLKSPAEPPPVKVPPAKVPPVKAPPAKVLPVKAPPAKVPPVKVSPVKTPPAKSLTLKKSATVAAP